MYDYMTLCTTPLKYAVDGMNHDVGWGRVHCAVLGAVAVKSSGNDTSWTSGAGLKLLTFVIDVLVTSWNLGYTSVYLFTFTDCIEPVLSD